MCLLTHFNSTLPHKIALLTRKEVSKSNGYLWQEVYMSAVLEIDDALMPTRICEALAAIEQRLLSPIDEGCEEHKAIENAQRALLTLKIEEQSRVLQRLPRMAESARVFK
jgi:hypothetical protein